MEDIEKTNTLVKNDSPYSSESTQAPSEKINSLDFSPALTPTSQSTRKILGVRWFLVVVSLISATFLWGLDGTIVADIQATYVNEFDAIDKLAWNSVAFFLGAAATVLSW